MDSFFVSPHTTSTVYTDYACDIHFGCPHSARLSRACEVAHLGMCVCHCSRILCVSQLSCFLVWKSARLVWMHKSMHVCSGRVQLFWQTGQLPPIYHCKENIDIKWPNCATQRGGGGGWWSAFHRGQPEWIVWHFVVCCDRRAEKRERWNKQNLARGHGLLLKNSVHQLLALDLSLPASFLLTFT